MKAAVLVSMSLLLAGASAACADTTLSVVPKTTNISVGQMFAVDINVGSVADLYDYQFSLAFDPTLLQADSVTEGALFAGTGNSFFLPGTIDNSSGAITLNYDTLFGPGPGVTGPGTIAVAEFTALANGSSSIDLSPLSDLILQDSAGNTLDVTAQAANIDVGTSVTPEPASVILLLTGLLLMGICVRYGKSMGGSKDHSDRFQACVH